MTKKCQSHKSQINSQHHEEETLSTRAATFTKFGKRFTSSTNPIDPVYTELPDLIFFIMQICKIADIFPKKTP